MVVMPSWASACPIAGAPSSQSDRSRKGSGGTSEAQTTNASWFIGPWRLTIRVTTLPQAHDSAAATVSTKPASGMSAPGFAPISARARAGQQQACDPAHATVRAATMPPAAA